MYQVLSNFIVAVAIGWSFCGSANAWPDRAVRLILPVPAGSASDFTARLFAERLSVRWAQPVIIENRPRVFDAMMANIPNDRHASLAAAYDFSGVDLIADIGGGNGATLRQILARYPKAHGLIYERDDVIRALTAADLMDGRITAKGGSFFGGVPPGADIYLLVRVLHDWADLDCIRILRACRAAIGPKSLLLVCEQVLDAECADPAFYLIDTQMMAMFGHARERSVSDFHELFVCAGFVPARIISTASPISILEAVPQYRNDARE
jgi:hypothetical protein